MWLIDWSSWVFLALIEILKQHDKETGSDINSDFSGRLQEMDFVRYERDVKKDEKYYLSLLKSSTGSSSLVAADPAAPQMSDRGRSLLRLHQEERVQLLSSSDGSFDYIKAAKVAKDAIAVWSPTVWAPSSTVSPRWWYIEPTTPQIQIPISFVEDKSYG